MGGFAMRRWVLTLSLLLCRVALADEPAAPKPLSMAVVDQVVEASDRAVQACNRSSRRLDTLAVLLTLTIDGDGKVTMAEAVRDGLDAGKAPAEAECLARVAKRLKFPATGTVSRVQYPFMLLPRARRPLGF
jgi:hypothetical protein